MRSVLAFRISIILIIALLSAMLPAPFQVLKAGGEPLSFYYLDSPPSGAAVLPPGIRLWDKLWIGGKEVLLLEADFRLEHSLAELDVPWGRIESPAAGEQFFSLTNHSGLALDQGAPSMAERVRVVLMDDHRALVVASQPAAESLAEEGWEIRAIAPPNSFPVAACLPAEPITLQAWDARIQEIINRVGVFPVFSQIGNLSGENAVILGGIPYTILTRNSYQTVPIQKATQYCYEYFQSRGVGAGYHQYSWSGRQWRNVVGTITGCVHPNEIFVICAHLDDMPSSTLAPGADDNASGSAAVLLAADILSGYTFEHTLRFVLFTGEEQGLQGSYAYVRDCQLAGESIVGALNFDMIAYDSNQDNRIELHCGTTAASGFLGDLFVNTITTYSLPLDPVKITVGSTDASDHASFWAFGYPAILGIEDTQDDFNPYYHTTEDTLANSNTLFATRFTKAALGTLARLAIPCTLNLTAIPTAFTFLATEGGPNPASQVMLVRTGGLAASWHLAESAPWLELTPKTGTGTGQAVLSARIEGFSTGTYTTTVSLFCSGATNSPLEIPVRLEILPPEPIISLSPTAFTFTATAGDLPPAAQALAIRNGGEGELRWNANADASWLALSPTSGTNTSSATLSVDSAGLAPGIYGALVSVSAAGATNSPQIVPVTLELKEHPPVLACSPTIFHFSSTYGDPESPVQAIQVWNAGGGTLLWSVAGSVPWLDATPENGSGSATIALVVHTAGLLPGTYSATLGLTAPGAIDSPQFLPVTLTVSQPAYSQNLQAGWNMVSIGLETGKTPTELFGPGLLGIFRWDPAGLRYLVPTQLEPGEGCWVKVAAATSITVLGQPTLPPLELACPEGWVQAGNPFFRETPWGHVRTKLGGETKTLPEAQVAGWIGGAYTWDGSSYRAVNFSSDALAPGQAAWLQVKSPGLALLFGD